MTDARRDRGLAESQARSRRDRPAFLVYAALVLTVLAVVVASLVSDGDALSSDGDVSVGSIAVWALFCAVANVLPVPVGRNVYLSMSSAANIAIAYVFPARVATTLVFAAAFSEWELKRETTPLHALFNRAQLAVATLLASLAFSLGDDDVVPAAWIAVLAVVTYQTVNLALVALAERTARGAAFTAVVTRLLPRGAGAVLAYWALGLLGLVFGVVYVRIGAWAVALSMLPLIAARYALAVSRALEEAEREQRMLADRLIDERERERARIASDMHDVVLQQLAAVQIQADNVVSALETDDRAGAATLAGEVKAGVAEAIAQLHGFISNLHRAGLDEGGLAPTLERLGRAFHAETGIEVAVGCDGVGRDDIPLPVGLLLYECCQEALTNVARHAGASRVEIDVRRSGQALELRVRDDGVGAISPGDPAMSGNGMGLELTREKMALSGGGFWVDSRPGAGTVLTVRLPVREQR